MLPPQQSRLQEEEQAELVRSVAQMQKNELLDLYHARNRPLPSPVCARVNCCNKIQDAYMLYLWHTYMYCMCTMPILQTLPEVYVIPAEFFDDWSLFVRFEKL